MRNRNTVRREEKREKGMINLCVCVFVCVSVCVGVCVVYARVFGNTYLTCSIRSPFSDQFLCVDASKAKGVIENRKGRYTLMNSERRGKKK